MWYDVNNTLSHNCLFNFVVGPRGVGKTYSSKRRVIKNFLNRGEQFIYIRRFEQEVKQAQLKNFFDDIGTEFAGYDLKCSSKTFKCGEEAMGWALPLSKAAQIKSVPYPNVSMIIFDEFIIDVGLIRYLPNEVQSFLEMYSTIARLRDVPVLFLSNAITFTNPYFVYFNVQEPTAKNKIWKRGDVLVQYVDSVDYTQAAKQTRFGKLIEGTEYARYAQENEFLRDNDKFIAKMPGGMKCRAIFTASGESFGLFTSGGNELWYVAETFDPTTKLVIALDNASHDEDNILSTGPARVVTNLVREAFSVGNLRFTSVKAKNFISPYLISKWR